MDVKGLNEAKVRQLVEVWGVKGIGDVVGIKVGDSRRLERSDSKSNIRQHTAYQKIQLVAALLARTALLHNYQPFHSSLRSSQGEGLEGLEGWGVKSRDKLMQSISETKSKPMSLERLVYSLGIRHVGIGVAGVIAREIKSTGRLIEIAREGGWGEAEDWDGVGGVIVESLKEWGGEEGNLEELEELVEALNVEEVEEEEGREGIWKGKKVSRIETAGSKRQQHATSLFSCLPTFLHN